MMETSHDEDDDTFHFVSRSRPLSETVVRGIAYVKGVDPVDLEPLASYIDPSALDVIFAKTESGTVQFEMDDLEVLVHASGEVKVTRATENEGERGLIHDELDDPSNVLLLAGPNEDERCCDLLFPTHPHELSVLGVTLDESPDQRLRTWNAYTGTLPHDVSIIATAEFTRSTNESKREESSSCSRVSIDTIQCPEDLAALGTTIQDWLSTSRNSDLDRSACFHSMTTLLTSVGGERTFKFLHLLMHLMEEEEVRAHYHLDPSAHDDATVRTISALFDTIVRVGESGNWTIES